MTKVTNEILSVARLLAHVGAHNDHKRERELFGQLTGPICNLVEAIRAPLEEKISAQEQEIAQLKQRLDGWDGRG